MIQSIKNYASHIFSQWAVDERKSFLQELDQDKQAVLLDLGCGDGSLTMQFAKKIKAKKIIGVELGGIRSKSANRITIVPKNLNKNMPFKSNTFDVVVSHFSIEHLYDTGKFISETKRVLKKGGYTVVATDNLSAWPNIISLFFGWQPFSSAGGVAKRSLGNPLAIRSSEEDHHDLSLGELSHNKVLAYQMLVDAYKEYGFIVEKVVGVGYFPFYGFFSNLLANLDKRHSHFLILKARK